MADTARTGRVSAEDPPPLGLRRGGAVPVEASVVVRGLLVLDIVVLVAPALVDWPEAGPALVG